KTTFEDGFSKENVRKRYCFRSTRAHGHYDSRGACTEESSGSWWAYRGLNEAAKVIDKHAAQLCVLAEDCNQPDYVKLIKALCADNNVSLILVPSAKTLGEWAGLCKLDKDGKARKVIGCSCVVVKSVLDNYEAKFTFRTSLLCSDCLQDFGEETEALHVVQEEAKPEKISVCFNSDANLSSQPAA
ncbi:hypothetical protein C3L33_06232, partial [Rhododendron williamsianum]